MAMKLLFDEMKLAVGVIACGANIDIAKFATHAAAEAQADA
jgi:hypothetical protein